MLQPTKMTELEQLLAQTLGLARLAVDIANATAEDCQEALEILTSIKQETGKRVAA